MLRRTLRGTLPLAAALALFLAGCGGQAPAGGGQVDQEVRNAQEKAVQSESGGAGPGGPGAPGAPATGRPYPGSPYPGGSPR